MTIQQVYEKYSTPKNLQEHMLRVAALSKIICDNWTGVEINKLEILKACLLHDIAKPINFDNTKHLMYGITTQEIGGITKLQSFINKEYNGDEGVALLGITTSLGISDGSINILKSMEWKHTMRLLSENNIETLIPVYCDRRIGPNGVLSLQQRLDDLKSRAKVDYYDDYVKNGEILEQRIQEFVSLDLNSITDGNLNALFSELLNLEI